MRLDKLLANTGHGSRKDVKTLLKKKQVTINESVVKDGSIHVEPNVDKIKVRGMTVSYQKYIYLMMNKPQGVISATVDDRDKTVIDLLTSDLHLFKAFPVGRLDKDTEGLMLITNDGELTHQLVSPNKEIEKVYFAKINGFVTNDDIDTFAEGIILGDGYKAKSAKLTILKSDTVSEIEVTITEGKYHQVKRMFASVNKKVIYLKRMSMGELILDDTIESGDYRELTETELDYCLSLKE